MSGASNFLMKNGINKRINPKKKKLIFVPTFLLRKSDVIIMRKIIMLVAIPYATDPYSFL
jgi:hypothetical protein